MIRSRFIQVIVGSILFLPAPAGAEGTTCTNPTVIVPDGRITASTIPAGATFYFLITSRGGNSYSVEFHNILGAAVQTPGTLTVYSNAACTATVTPTDTASVDPADLNGNRVSYTATTTQTRFALSNTSGSPITYSFSVSDTTMFSASWSTNATYNTYYSFLNTTGSTLAGTLTLYDTVGNQVGSPNNFTINPNTTASTNTVVLGTLRDRTGTAKFTHSGPPGAILAEAAIANFTFTTPYIQPVKFVSPRESTH